MLIIVLSIFLLLQLLFLFYGRKHINGERVNDTLSFVVFYFFVGLFFFKNEYFGADTKNYLFEFSQYCLNPDAYVGLDFTYALIFHIINALIAGACHISWLVWVWPIFVISLIYFSLCLFKCDKLYIVALFASFIGLELLTNAMRQGFSLAVLILALCFFLKGRYVYFVLFSLLSFLFHQASILIVAILLASRINYKILIPGLLAGIYIVFFTTYVDFLPGVNGFKSSIYKYMPYSDDDFIVRIISLFVLLCTSIVYTWMSFRSDQKDVVVLNSLLNIISICMIVSIVPYLGFRVIYGVYPLVLLMTYTSMSVYNRKHYIYLSVVTCINAIVSIIWLCGSTHMRAIPFVSFI